MDAGKDIMVSAGTITYTGLTEVATYVNGSAGTTLASGEMSHVVCVVETVDANNFETANDGANYGSIEMEMLNVYSEQKSADWASRQFHRSVPDDSLVLHVTDGLTDWSRYKHTLTNYGATLGGRMRFDGTNDKLDCGDVGSIQAVSLWVNPNSDTEELFLVDTGKDVMIDSGTVTYTGLTEVATYINGSATTTYEGNWWQNIVCVFEAVDANNFEIATDGANYGQIDVDELKAFSSSKGLSDARILYETGKGLL